MRRSKQNKNNKGSREEACHREHAVELQWAWPLEGAAEAPVPLVLQRKEARRLPVLTEAETTAASV